MPRKPKIKLKINDAGSFLDVINDILDDIQNNKSYVFNELKKISEKEEIDFMKIKIQYLMILNENSKTKLMLAKIIKQTVSSFTIDYSKEKQTFSLEDFAEIRKMIRKKEDF
jgi:hypothetical protein